MCACLLAALVLSQIAKADTITFLDSNGSIQVDVTYIFNGNRNTERVAAGQYNFHINGSTLTSSGFCTDLKTDAQLALWDLSLGGLASYNSHTNSYCWSNIFSAADSGQNSYRDIAGVYTVEQCALAHSYRTWNALFENAGPHIQGRKQDLAFASTPEASSVVALATLLAGCSILPLRFRRARWCSPQRKA